MLIWNLLLEYNTLNFISHAQSLDLSPIMPQFGSNFPVPLPAGFEWRCSFVLGFDSLMLPEFYLYFVQLLQPSLSISHWISTFLNTFLLEVPKLNTRWQYIFLYILSNFSAQWFNRIIFTFPSNYHHIVWFPMDKNSHLRESQWNLNPLRN